MKQIPQKTSLISFDTILNKANIKKGQVVAELGCGKSLFLLYALSTLVGQDGLVYGIDILPEIIDTIKREVLFHDLQGIKAILGDIEETGGTKLEEGGVDKAFIINTIHQSSKTINVLSETKRILNKKGLLIVVDWEKDQSPFGPSTNQKISPEQIKEAAEIAGLKYIEQFKPGQYHYGLIFINK